MGHPPVTHYDDYPYPNPAQYRVEDIPNLRTESAPRAETWEQWFPGEKPGPKRVLVVGCGVWEAIAIAAQESLLDVIGIDSSARTIGIASGLAEQAGVKNVSFFHDNPCDWPHEGTKAYSSFDLVCASGVLHHIHTVEPVLRKLRQLMNPGANIAVMVYGDRYREFLPVFCDMLRRLGVCRNAHGIKFVRGLLASLPPHHPVKEFVRTVDLYDAQVVDLFLHPYFRQYSAADLIFLMERERFKFLRWLNPACDFSLFEGLPAEFGDITSRFEQLSFIEKSRIGQIFTHADLKLAALFTR